MTNDDLKKALFMERLINATEDGLKKIQNWILNFELNANTGGIPGYNDNNYNLCICKYSDGSGPKIDLCRYMGNTEILQLIEKALEKQLEQFKKDFEEI